MGPVIGLHHFHTAIAMTPEKKARLRELSALIANEDDPDTMKNLALEFQRLLDEEDAERDRGRQEH